MLKTIFFINFFIAFSIKTCATDDETYIYVPELESIYCNNTAVPVDIAKFVCLGDGNQSLMIIPRPFPAPLITITSTTETFNFTLILPNGLSDLTGVSLEIVGESVYSSHTVPSEDRCRYTFVSTNRNRAGFKKPLLAFLMFYDPVNAMNKTADDDYVDVLGITFPEGTIPTQIYFESVIRNDEAYFRVPDYDNVFRSGYCLWKTRKRGGYVRYQIAFSSVYRTNAISLVLSDSYSIPDVKSSLSKVEPGIPQSEPIPTFVGEGLTMAIMGKDYYQDLDGTWTYKEKEQDVKKPEKTTIKPSTTPSSSKDPKLKKKNPPKQHSNRTVPLIVQPEAMGFKEFLKQGPVAVLIVIVLCIVVISIIFCVSGGIIFEKCVLKPVDSMVSSKTKSQQGIDNSIKLSSTRESVLEAKTSSADFYGSEKSLQKAEEEGSSTRVFTSDVATYDETVNKLEYFYLKSHKCTINNKF